MEYNKIYNECCLETMKRIEDNSIDLILTSPPYDDLRDYNTYRFYFKRTADSLVRILKNNGIIVWIVNDKIINCSESCASFKQVLYFKEYLKLNLFDTMIYKKKGIQYPDETRYYQCFEYMFVLAKGKPKTINLLNDRRNKYVRKITGSNRKKSGELKNKSSYGKLSKKYGVRFNIWEYNVGWMQSYREKYLREHPAIMPIKLAIDHIVSWSNENDIIYDPFMGSGTTAIACLMNCRKYIGSEISKKYHAMSLRRINDYNQNSVINIQERFSNSNENKGVNYGC